MFFTGTFFCLFLLLLLLELFFGVVAFYSYQRLGRRVILVLLLHLILTDHRLMRLSGGALRCVE